MDIKQYYQSGRYHQDMVSWRKTSFFPLRYRFITKNLPVDFKGNILDAGCGDGSLLSIIKQHYPKVNTFGVDISREACRLAQMNGVQARVADLNQPLPFIDNFFDFIIAHESIEHLSDPDQFLDECRRVLRPGGWLIVTTPNLANWYQRLFFLLGYYPLFMELSTRDRRIGMGILKKIIKNTQPVGHLRVFTLKALKDLVGSYNFKVKVVKGSPIFVGLAWPLNWLFDTLEAFFSFFPSLSSNILVIAQKK